jgi:hypothetical protein
MFKILLKNLTVGIKQIEKCNTPEGRKKKAVELGFIKNLNRMKDVDEPSYDEYMAKYKKATEQG